MWPIRSMLFIPANKLNWVEKVARFRPDAVILDLEDAVPASAKDAARQTAREGLALLSRQQIRAFVRVNALAEGCASDLAAVVCNDLDGVMLPKVEAASEIVEFDRLLSYHEGKSGVPWGKIAILPLPETAKGLHDARLLAAASKRVKGLANAISGPVSGDIARAFGFRPTTSGLEQLYMNSKIVLDSRAGGAFYPMASVFGTRLDDFASVRELVTRAKNIGYTGVMLMHPSHVEIANEIYTPTAEEIRYFSGMIDAIRAAEKQGAAAVNYEGRMVDLAMIPLAEEVLSEAAKRGLLPRT